MNPKVPSTAWASVVEAERRFAEAVAAIPLEELQDTLVWALGDFTSRPVALRILAGAHPQLTSRVLLALDPLLLVSHSLLVATRALVLRLPRAELLEHLEQLTALVVKDPSSDYEAYRRLAELLRAAQADDALARLVGAASQSTDLDIEEVGQDFV